MGIDSSADLLFRIAGDSSPAQADLAALRGAVSSAVGDIGSGFAGMEDAAASAGRRTTSEMTEARHALRGIGEEMGVAMPRFVSTWLASLNGVAPVMAMAFAPVAVIGFIRILAEIPGEIQKGIDALHGWTEESKKAFEESTRAVLKAEVEWLSYIQQFREIGLIGLSGLPKMNAELKLNQEAFGEATDKLTQYLERRQQLQKIAEWKPKPQTAPGSNMLPDVMGAAPDEEQGSRHDEIEKAKAELKELDPMIAQLQGRVADLDLEGKRIAAQVKADSATAATDAQAAAERTTEDLQKRVLAQTEQTLAVKQQEWDEEVDGLRRSYAEKAKVTAAQEEMLAKLRQLGHERVAREDAEAQEKAKDTAERATTQLQREIEAQQAKSSEQERRAADLHIAELTEQYRKDGQLTAQNIALLEELRGAMYAKQYREQQAADARETADLEKELAGEAKTVQAKHALLDLEMDARQNALKRDSQNLVENLILNSQLRAAGHAKIDADAKAEGDSELARLAEERKRIEGEYATSEDRIAAGYLADVAKFSAAEEKKALAAETSPAKQAQITAQYAAIRAALYLREQGQLQQLADSTGWQGVFGSKFQDMIRNNETLMHQWATGVSQGALLVKASLQGLEDMGKAAFDQLAQGMATNIVHAIMYGQSVSKAMKQALAATLESIAGKSAVDAIYATALGFLELAEGDYEGAGNAFAAAAVFGSVAAAAAVAGRAVVGPQGGAGGSGGSGAGSGGGAPGVNQFGANAAARSADQAAGYQQGGTAASGGTQLHVHFYGPVMGTNGVQEVCAMINDAVLNKDTTLTATNTKTGVQVTR